MNNLTYWYNPQAEGLFEALPIGNVCFGAMFYRGTGEEVIQFNEDTLWTGQPHYYAHKDTYKVLSKLR